MRLNGTDTSPTAALRFLVALDEALTAIRARPETFPIATGAMRRTLLRRFPYAIYFKVYDRTISVVGVVHGHRHPRTWLRREPSQRVAAVGATMGGFFVVVPLDSGPLAGEFRCGAAEIDARLKFRNYLCDQAD